MTTLMQASNQGASRPDEIAADCASKWATSPWIAALVNGNQYDLMSIAHSYSNFFRGNIWEQHTKWLVTDDQLYIADLFNCSGCLDSTL